MWLIQCAAFRPERCGPLAGAQFGRTIELNSIHCNPMRPWQFAVAGGDDYVRIYDQRRTAGNSLGGQSANMALPVRLSVHGLMRDIRISFATASAWLCAKIVRVPDLCPKDSP